MSQVSFDWNLGIHRRGATRSVVKISSLMQRPLPLEARRTVEEHLIIRARLLRGTEVIATVCIYDLLLNLDIICIKPSSLIRCDDDINILGKKKSQLVTVDGKRTYAKNAFDIGPGCRSCATAATKKGGRPSRRSSYRLC